MKKVQITLEDDLHLKMKQDMLESNLTINNWFIRVINFYFRNNAGKQ